jgi:hypothetical protein
MIFYSILSYGRSNLAKEPRSSSPILLLCVPINSKILFVFNAVSPAIVELVFSFSSINDLFHHMKDTLSILFLTDSKNSMD